MILLTGCGGAKLTGIENIAPKVEIPQELTQCKPEPVPDAEMQNQRQLANFIVDLADAGEDCRAKLKSIKSLID